MESAQQNPTPAPIEPEVDAVPIPFDMLTPQQQAWVDFNVVQGTIVESDGEMHKMSIREFADHYGVNRSTCYDWITRIPNFWDLVEQRRKVVFTGARTAKVWNALFINATVKLNFQAQAAWLHNASTDFQLPNQNVQHEASGSLLDVLEIARKRRLQGENAIEAEVVEPDAN